MFWRSFRNCVIVHRYFTLCRVWMCRIWLCMSQWCNGCNGLRCLHVYSTSWLFTIQWLFTSMYRRV